MAALNPMRFVRRLMVTTVHDLLGSCVIVHEDRRVPARARIALASAIEGNGDVPLRGLRAGGVSVHAASVKAEQALTVYTPGRAGTE